MWHFIIQLKSLLLNLGDEKQWETFIAFVGASNIYGVMFAIIFVETGLVIMPFLPGDSLLFALGAIGSNPEVGIDYKLAAGLLIVAALLGDNLNYWIGRKFGPMIFSREADAVAQGTKPGLLLRMLNKNHLHRTEAFFNKYGAKAVVLARFVAIVRTFTPFVAGLGRMHYGRFLIFSFLGALLWVPTCVGAGVLLGRIPFVKHNFEYIVMGIVAFTIVPFSIEFWRHRREKQREQTLADTAAAAAASVPPSA